ncbi:MAG: LacI family DNA-binding transcriptional regulator [Phycisphaerales bacterium]
MLKAKGQIQRVTSVDVAREAGVSQITVSRAFTGKIPVSDSMRQRVMAAAHRLRYRPNSAAAAMNAGRFGAVALLAGTYTQHNLMSQALMEAIHDALGEHDLHLTLARLPDEKLTDSQFVPRILRQWSVDGLLINYNAMFPRRLEELVVRYRLPSVWINSKHHDNCVYPDDLAAGRYLTRYLLSLGHRKIAFANYNYGFNAESPPGHYSAVDRREGYLQVMREAGLEPRLFHGEELRDFDLALAFSKRWLAAKDRPTGVVIDSRSQTAAPIRLAAAGLGLLVPGDLSMAAFGGIPPTGKTELNITTLGVPEYEVGRAAVEMLIRKVNHAEQRFPPRAVAFTEMAGASCAQPAESN